MSVQDKYDCVAEVAKAFGKMNFREQDIAKTAFAIGQRQKEQGRQLHLALANRALIAANLDNGVEIE